MRFEVKRDRFRSARGGTSHFINLFCTSCKGWVALYQKDGQGNLYRLYFDRIHAPEQLAQLQDMYVPSQIHEIPSLICSCGQILAHPMIFDQENRLAYRIVLGTLFKEISNGVLEGD